MEIYSYVSVTETDFVANTTDLIHLSVYLLQSLQLNHTILPILFLLFELPF